MNNDINMDSMMQKKTDVFGTKIQYKSKPLDIESEKRYLLYRIDPSELPWWKRVFRNPWRKVFRSYSVVSESDKCVNDCLCFLFKPNEARDVVDKCGTYGELIEFLHMEYKKASDMYCGFLLKRKDEWDF